MNDRIDRKGTERIAMRDPRGVRPARRSGALAALPALVALAACDTTVTNPGPVPDEFLDDPTAQTAIVNGMGRALAEAINFIGYTSASVTREIHPSGSTGSFGITVRWQRGILEPADRDLNDHWELAQQARWWAESGITRIEPAPRSDDILARAYLWAGYANRLLGENMCQAVIDGGAAEPDGTEYFNRAEGWFTLAAQTGTGDVRTAAFAGRASVRIFLDKWGEAVADADSVPDDFVFEIPYYDLGEDAQRNRIHWASAGQPYKAHTVWNTVYEQYYRDFNDPRVAFVDTGETGDAAIDCCGKVPWYQQQKHPSSAAPIRLSSGREMRLIEAEYELLQSGTARAMAIINGLRAAVGVAPWPAPATIEEAWAYLKRERGIELWLEARRLGDLRRWQENGTPGALDPLELPAADPDAVAGSHLERQDLCFPIPPSERETNPNL